MMGVGLNNHEFGYPSVHEAVVFREPFSHDDFIEEFERGGLNATTVFIEEAKHCHTPDYTAQLEFHQRELSQAEQRGFPPGQISYHVEKIRTLGHLVNNVIEVDFVKKERL